MLIAKGFTLIELIMVIVILGMLAVVALPRYINLKQAANVAAVKGMLGAIRSAVMIYYASGAVYWDSPSYPHITVLSSGVLFSDGQMPMEPISNSRAVSVGFGAGAPNGWVYWQTGGSVACAAAGYSTY